MKNLGINRITVKYIRKVNFEQFTVKTIEFKYSSDTSQLRYGIFQNIQIIV